MTDINQSLLNKLNYKLKIFKTLWQLQLMSPSTWH